MKLFVKDIDDFVEDRWRCLSVNHVMLNDVVNKLYVLPFYDLKPLKKFELICKTIYEQFYLFDKENNCVALQKTVLNHNKRQVS